MNENRFNRQIILPEIGKIGQERLKKARVLCVGMGGLGSPASLYLAAAGVGTLGLIDPDTVDLTNLQRQILFGSSDLGSSKVELAKKRLKALDPNTVIETYGEALNAQNAEHLFSGYDLILDGTDNFSTKFLINDAACKLTLPVVYGAVDQFEGQVALFFGKQGACYRCFYPKPPEAQIKNCAEAGVLGSVVGVVGTLQATLALEQLISQGDPAHPLCPQTGSLTLVDLKGSWSIRSIQIPKNPDCSICSLPSDKIQLTSELLEICETRTQLLLPDKLQSMLLDRSLNLYVLDVREEDEWGEGHLKDAHLFPLSLLEKGELPKIPRWANRVVVYCQSGVRSAKAIQRLSQVHATHSFYNLKGGLSAWSGPLVTTKT